MNNKIEYKNNKQIITINNKKYLKIRKENINKELYEYLISKNFKHILSPIEENKNYELYQYSQETTNDAQKEFIELINIISDLHNKTTTYHEVKEEKISEMYTSHKNNLTSLKTYYFEIQDYLETKEFPSPEEQLLLNNISNIYKAINYSEFKINAWYEKVKQKNKIRHVQLHNNISRENLLKDKIYYLINWDKSKNDIPIYDFITLYKNEFINIDMKELFSVYQRQYKYSEDEQLLFEAILSIPPKITFKKSHLINTIEAKKHLNYIETTSEFLKDNKEYQEDNK
jgi:hypothetical protein